MLRVAFPQIAIIGATRGVTLIKTIELSKLKSKQVAINKVLITECF